MKFNLLEIGQKFRFKGEIYTKSGPLQAIPEGSGNHKMMMRSAAVELIDNQATTEQTAPGNPIDPVVLRKALDHYHEQCLSIIAGGKTPLSIEANNRLEEAYRRITSLLG